MDIVRKHFDIIDSTNTWAKQNADQLERDKITLVTADVQTAGRGRFKRHWESPAGLNIYATFCIFMEKHRTDIGNLPQVLAISAVKLLQKIGFKGKLKWPNDVLISGKKVAGILCETTPLSDYLCVALGIGLNVNMPLEILQKIDRSATSLLSEDGVARNVEEMTQKLQMQFIGDLEVFIEEGFHPFLETYKKFLVHMPGDNIRFHDNRVIWKGSFKGINENGSLNLELESGVIKTFIAGEIIPDNFPI